MPVKTCNNIGCNNPRHLDHDFCITCLHVNEEQPDSPLMSDIDVCAAHGQTSKQYLHKASETQDSRAAEYDSEGVNERSMGKVVKMFNTLTGLSISETDGWRFMEILKMVRSQGRYHEDSLVDGVSYASLAAESAYREAHLN